MRSASEVVLLSIVGCSWILFGSTSVFANGYALNADPNYSFPSSGTGSVPPYQPNSSAMAAAIQDRWGVPVSTVTSLTNVDTAHPPVVGDSSVAPYYVFGPASAGAIKNLQLNSVVVSGIVRGELMYAGSDLFGGWAQLNRWVLRAYTSTQFHDVLVKVVSWSGTTTPNSYYAATWSFYQISSARSIPTPPPPVDPPKEDFNGDGKPDYVLFNMSTRQTAIWYLNNNVLVSTASGPTIAAGWQPVAVADFNSDGKPDYVLFNTSTRQTAIWYLNNNVLVSSAYGPNIPSGWELVAVAPLNGDGDPDYVLYNASTRQTAIWYLNNNVYISSAYGPTIASGYELTRAADFSGDGKPDYVLYNPSTRQTAIWYLNGNVFVSGAYGPTIASGYALTGVADFSGDGKSDYVLYNPSTRQTAIWYLNGNVFVSGAYGPTVPSGWSLVAP